MSDLNEMTPEMAATARKFLENLANRICPHCQKPIEEEEQIGRCVYSKSCGHRLYQGKAVTKMAHKRKLHPYLQEMLDKENEEL
jgi:hypothetical protein